ncbi:MAG: hypothetical protein KIT31_02520 [Deltaproteobacteria bacterium]|nr:hypothetical protein [Deltaproteobacteria bacterium]
MRALGVAALIAALCGVGGEAAANGRPPAGRSITFRHGAEQHIVVGATFGILFSHDGGATWQWMCELAAFYGGEYDPFYAYAAGGEVWVTTNEQGLHVMRDGCKFEKVPSGRGVLGRVSTIAMGPDGAVYGGAAVVAMPPDEPGDSRIYKAGDGSTLAPLSTPGEVGDWWESIRVAPSDAQRVYLSGFRIRGERQHLLFASSDGGATFQPRPATGFMTTPGSAIDFVGVAPGEPDVVYARVQQERDAASQGLYRSDDGGQTWTRILGSNESMSVLVRHNGDVVAATLRLGSQVSHDRGATWQPLASPPHIHCLAENSAGEVWACTQNYSVPAVPADGFALMKTTDLATWAPVLELKDVQEPVACAPGTEQQRECEPLWCGVVEYLGIKSPMAAQCAAPPVDAPPPPETKPGCCDAGSHPLAAAAPLALVGLVLLRRRRRR